MLKKLSVVFFSVFIFSLSAQAMILFAPSVSYMDQKQNNQSVETQAKLTLLDFRLGYVFDFGLYIGGLYSIQDQQILSDSSDSYLGPSIGYYNSGFLIVGTYYLYGEKDITSGVGKLTRVKGYQIDVSYSVPVTANFRIGPQLSYHNYSFDEMEVNGIAQPTEFSFSSLTPYFNLMFLF